MKENDLIKNALSENVTDKDDIYRKIILSAKQTTRNSFVPLERNTLLPPHSVAEKHKTSKRSNHTMKRTINIAETIELLSITAFASVRLLTPREVAQDMIFTDESGVVYDHFATPFTFDEAVEINESHTDAELKITFLGFAHGEGIEVSELAVDRNKTYAVIAIENEDGTPIETIETMLTVSPLVKGMNPGLHNGFTFGTSGKGTLIDGVQYQLMELEVIEYFAENHLYLSVSDTMPGMPAYIFDEQSGEITANPDYEGINVLFDLPIDPAKADSEKVDEYLQRIENPEENEVSDEDNSSSGGETDFFEMTKEEVAAGGELIFEDIVTANPDGSYSIYWNDIDIFTTMPGEDVMTFEIGVAKLFSVTGNNETNSILFIERISETELKTSVYSHSI